MNRKDFFRLFHDISDYDFQLLSEALEPKFFKKGTMLTVPGKIQKELYFVESGVQMSYFDKGKKK